MTIACLGVGPLGTRSAHWGDQGWTDERGSTSGGAAVVADDDVGRRRTTKIRIRTRVQQEWVRRLLATCPIGGIVSGRAMRHRPVLPDRGRKPPPGRRHRPIGRHARPGASRAALPASCGTLEGLQEMEFVARFDNVAVTVDAMENIAPEDWPVVLANLRPRLCVTRRPPLLDRRRTGRGGPRRSPCVAGCARSSGGPWRGRGRRRRRLPVLLSRAGTGDELDRGRGTRRRRRNVQTTQRARGYRHLLLRSRHTPSPTGD